MISPAGERIEFEPSAPIHRTWTLSPIGFMQDAAKREGVYFRMLQAAHFGHTTAGPKMSVGAQPMSLAAWIWDSASMRRRTLGFLTRTVMRPVPPVERNAFRVAPVSYADPALLEPYRRIKIR